jgi:hypothetical protein
MPTDVIFHLVVRQKRTNSDKPAFGIRLKKVIEYELASQLSEFFQPRAERLRN